ncbi:MAG: hypothetical protein AB1439_11795 [candidate division FCPU426 bacterium]
MRNECRLSSWGSRWLKLGALAVLLAAAGTAQAADAVMDRIHADLNSKLFDIYETTYGQPAQTNLVVGKEYLLAVNTTNLSVLGNRFILFSKKIRDLQIITRHVCFRVDPAAADDAQVDVSNSPDNWRWWKFTLPDDPMVQELMVMRLELKYKPAGETAFYYAYKYFNLTDPTPDRLIVFNTQAPLITRTLRLGYLGGQKTEADIASLHAQASAACLKATKGYAALTVDDQGRRAFPDDNAFVGNTIHAYSEWWNSLPHDLEGTSLLPLDPAVPQDLAIIKIAWYYQPVHTLQIRRDALELFGWTPPPSYQVLVDLPSGSGGGSSGSVDFSGIYNNVGFTADKSGVLQYGLHPDFGFQLDSYIVKTLLHEYAHALTDHPPVIELPTHEDWTVQIGDTIDHDHDIMRQADSLPYMEQLFYRDDSIASLVAPAALPAGATLMTIPFIDPVGDPLNQATWTLRGTKDSQAAVYINGSLAASGNTLTTWTATVNLALGQNAFEISQMKAGKRSHPRLLFVTRVAADQPVVPTAQLTWAYASSPVPAGKYQSFDLQARARAGLKAMWWWVEKQGANGQWEYVPGLGYWHDLYGSSVSTVRYYVSFPEPGTYKVCGRARDLAYPTPGQEHQSQIAELAVEVQ